LDDLIRGFSSNFGKTTTLMGAIASTVSSLSRARLFAYSGRGGSSNSDGSNFPATTTTFTEGCVGMIWQGDVQVRTLMASGAKPVGGIYRIVKGHDSTIQVIVLDQDATNELLPVELEQQNENSNDPLSKLQNEQDEDEDDDVPIKEDDKERRKRLMAEAYAKAAIPKPTLAEANFIMRALSDDEQAFMRKAILVGLERPRANMLSLSSNLQRSSTNGNDDDDDDDESNDNNENEYGDESKSEETVKSQGKDAGPSSVSATPSVPTTTLGRLAQGLGHGYTVHQVASAGMKDGSVTFALGSVTVQPGTRMRFFVRERAFAKKEIQALWMGYKKRVLDEQFSTMTNKPTTASPTSTKGSSPAAAAAAASFTPTGCFIFSTLDRGTKFFLGKPGFESRQVAQFLPTIPSIAGFFCNSVIGTLDDISATNPRLPNDSFLHGSASGYFLIGSSKYIHRNHMCWSAVVGIDTDVHVCLHCLLIMFSRVEETHLLSRTRCRRTQEEVGRGSIRKSKRSGGRITT
jgi:small ligand-binding sensory domain FIST